jgi:histidine triad (HIT) family protein
MDDCLFCRIAAGELVADVIFQDESVVAFRDVNPQAPVHFLVITRKHLLNFADAGPDDKKLLGHVALTASSVAKQEGIQESGFRTVVNNGPDAHQTVPHLHVHVLGGRQMGWPPG